MKGVQLKCVSCEQGWYVQRDVSDHEQQSLESKPCPNCGAMTLRCLRPEREVPLRLLLNASRRSKTELDPVPVVRAA